ncbi:MAG: DUF2189 domain-containing protein [Alphaproteobacteria bacterium]|nr:DUF2189 domain-containing protein [Alphaproteobacteria bacterium]
MTNGNSLADSGVNTVHPAIHKISLADLKDALKKGVADFNAAPTHFLFLALIYPIVTLVIARVYAGYEVLPLVFPLLAGYTLIGPLAATGMYELSRRREQGLDHTWWHVFGVLRSPSLRSIAILGLMLMVFYFAWLGTAQAIYAWFFGAAVPASVMGFVADVFTTRPGWGMIIAGSGAGFIFATVVFTLSVVSFPLLLDRDVGSMAAIQTSIRVVVANPLILGIWGFFIAAALLVGSLPFFFGLAVVVPVIGHASWHLYRKTVEW